MDHLITNTGRPSYLGSQRRRREGLAKMHGLELHRSWGRLAALVRALNGQRLLGGSKNWRHCGRAQPGHALRAGSAGPFFIIRPHPPAIRLCDVVRASCAWLGWTAQVELGLLVLAKARRGSVVAHVGTSLSASVWMLLDRWMLVLNPGKG